MESAIIYCRVSTKEQVEEGHSLETQERICRDYAKNHNSDLLRKPFIELGESAKTTDRPVLQEMLKYCVQNARKIDSIIIYKTDRLSRNLEDYVQMRALFDKLGIRVISTSENFGQDPIGRFIENTFANVSELDNAMRTERCKNGSIELVRKGMRNGRAPVGLRKIGSNRDRLIKKVEPQATFILKAFEMLNSGVYSEMDVYKIITKKGLCHYNGNPVQFVYFSKMIRNPIYKGFLTDWGQNVDSPLIEKIIGPKLFDQVQDFLTGRRRKMPKYKRQNPDFPIRGLVECEHKEKFTASTVSGNGGKYKKYRVNCSFCKKRNFDADDFHSRFAEYLQEHEINNEYVEALKIAIKVNWNLRNEHIIKETEQTKKTVDELKERKQRIINKLLEKPEQSEIWDEQLIKVEDEIKRINQKLDDAVNPEKFTEEVIDFGLNYLKHISDYWKDSEKLEEKQKFQNFFFPEGITHFQNGRFGTSVLPLCMRVKSHYASTKYPLVASRGIEPLLPH